MYERPTGIRYGLFIAALFMTNFIIMTDFVIYPIVDALYSHFPDQVNGVNFIVSGPSAIIVVTSLVVPAIMRRVDRKLLLVGGCMAFAVSAIGGCAIQSVPYMIACRSVGGVTYAIAQVCAISIISDYWPDEDGRASMVGYYNTAQAGAGAIMSFVSGNLAVGGWTSSYHTYWIAVPVLVMVVLFIPSLKGERASLGNSRGIDGDALAGFEGGHAGSGDGETPFASVLLDRPTLRAKGHLGYKFWLMAGCFTAFTLCYMIAIVTFISVYVAENGLGDVAFAGMLTSLNTIGSAVMCALFGRVFSHLKFRTSLPFYIIASACILVLFLVHSAPVAAVCCLVAGGCFGSLFSYNYAAGSLMVASEDVDRVTGVVTAAYGLAVFGSTYFATFLMDEFGTDRITDILGVLFVLCALVAIVEAFRTR